MNIFKCSSFSFSRCWHSTDNHTSFYSVLVFISAHSLVVVHFVFFQKCFHGVEHVIRVVSLVCCKTRIRVCHRIHVYDVKPSLTHGGQCIGAEQGNSLTRGKLEKLSLLLSLRRTKGSPAICHFLPQSHRFAWSAVELCGREWRFADLKLEPTRGRD